MVANGYTPEFKRKFAIEWDNACKRILGENEFQAVRARRKAEIEKEKEELARRRSLALAEAIEAAKADANGKAEALANGAEVFEEPESVSEIVGQ